MAVESGKGSREEDVAFPQERENEPTWEVLEIKWT